MSFMITTIIQVAAIHHSWKTKNQKSTSTKTSCQTHSASSCITPNAEAVVVTKPYTLTLKTYHLDPMYQ